MSLVDKLKREFKYGNASVKMIFINVAIFFVFLLWRVVSPQSFSFLERFLVLSGDWQVSFPRFWTFITYGFLHSFIDLLHLAVNMFMLYILGRLFFQFFRSQAFYTFYFFGIIAGGIAFLIYSTITQDHKILLGASAAVYSILFAIVSYSPKLPMRLSFFNISFPLDYLAYAILGMDLLMILLGDNIGGRISHFGGAAFGYFYMKQYETGKDFLGSFVHFLFRPTKVSFKSNGSKPKRKKKTQQTKTPPRSKYEYQDYKADKQKKIDAILDKISESGYSSLTKKEKDFLFQSKND